MNKKQCFISILIILTVLLAVPACGGSSESAVPAQDTAAETQPEEAGAEKPVIKLAQWIWLSYELDNMVAKILLEEELGYPVEIVVLDGDDALARQKGIVNGEIHTLLEVWPMSLGEDYWIDSRDKVEWAGTLGAVGRNGWFVPNYLLIEHPDLATWEGLKNPENIALFQTPETGDKGQFVGCPAGWDYLNSINATAISDLGLDLQLVEPDSEEELLTWVIEAYDKQEPILFYFWQPHWIFATRNFTQIELPTYSEGCDTKKETGEYACDYFPLEILEKAFWPGLKDYAPEAHHLLKNFSLLTEDQIIMMAAVEVDGKTVEEASRIWIDNNRDTWQTWLP